MSQVVVLLLGLLAVLLVIELVNRRRSRRTREAGIYRVPKRDADAEGDRDAGEGQP